MRRTRNLLADRALGDLDLEAQGELERLLARNPTLDDGSMERAATALALALMGSRGQLLPDDLRRRLEGC
ncbi:hypothetical protein [Engelhardtia mirabilis]|uniref:hypothetical protein n=1 Tax=Engelhardtia mirabilis TaxID=2528011 RepID=UPI003AF3A494